MLIDTHCHLHDQEWFFPTQAEQCLKHAKENGIEKIICIGTDPEDSQVAQAFASVHQGVYWTYGIHPEHASKFSQDAIELAKSLLISDTAPSTAVAIGEIGLDYHYDGYDRAAQIALFEQMLQLARDCNLPVSLHIREAFVDAFAVIDNFSDLTGVVHSFTGSKHELKQALDRGFYVGVNGLATYSTINLPPLEKMLLETDAPFLTPIPNRGTMNMPGYVRDIANYLAAKMGVAEQLIAEQTTKNAQQLFHI